MNLKLLLEQLEQAITEKTKAIIINSPSNPTGMHLYKRRTEQLGEVCLNIIFYCF